MDRVVNPPVGKLAQPSCSSWGIGIPAGIALTALAVDLLFFFASLGQARNFAADHWYALSTVEGTTTYTDYPSETACFAAEGGDQAACLSGADLKP